MRVKEELLPRFLPLFENQKYLQIMIELREIAINRIFLMHKLLYTKKLEIQIILLTLLKYLNYNKTNQFNRINFISRY